MRGRRFWGGRPAARWRHRRRSYELSDPGARFPILKWPMILLALWDSMSLGIRALNISANLSLEGTGTASPPPTGAREMAVTVTIALLIGVGLFVVIPLLVALVGLRCPTPSAISWRYRSDRYLPGLYCPGLAAP